MMHWFLNNTANFAQDDRCDREPVKRFMWAKVIANFGESLAGPHPELGQNTLGPPTLAV